jgi:excisionase family DNA binding protein
MEEKLLTEKELCQWLQISRPTAWRWRKEGMPFIKANKSIRFNKADVLKWLKSQRKSSEEAATRQDDRLPHPQTTLRGGMFCH